MNPASVAVSRKLQKKGGKPYLGLALILRLQDVAAPDEPVGVVDML